MAHLGHDSISGASQNVSEPQEDHLRDLASAGIPNAIRVIHAEITFAALHRETCFKETRQCFVMLVRVRGLGDGTYTNLEAPWNRHSVPARLRKTARTPTAETCLGKNI